MKFVVKNDGNGWIWELVSSNGTVVGRSVKTFASKKNARESVQSIIKNGSEGKIKLEVAE